MADKEVTHSEEIQSEPTVKCVYCLKEKSLSAFNTTEHIIPHSCGGGGVYDELFLTDRVCDDCNHKCGLFVDAAFLKGWSIHNDKAQSFMLYADTSRIKPIPFMRFGIFEALTSPDEACEYWSDFLGNRVYHFHENDERYSSYAGGNPINRKSKKKAGSAFLVFSENVDGEDYWITTALASLSKFFEKESKYVLNGRITDQSGNVLFGISGEDAETKAARIKQILDAEHKIDVSISLHAPTRFLSKISLGLGFNLLGDEFAASKYAEDLKDALWSYPSDRTPRLKGQTKLEMPDAHSKFMQEIMAWPGGNSLALFRVGDQVGFFLSFYGSFIGTHPICDDITIYNPSINIDEDGVVFIWIPNREDIKAVKLSYIDLVAHKTKAKLHPDLLQLEALRNDLDKILPQKMKINSEKGLGK